MTSEVPACNVTAVLSMLHEPPSLNSATRRFRSQPVLAWTLERLSMSQRLESMAVICWEDQLEEVGPIARERDCHILAKGPRVAIPSLDAVTAARRWADGWRGGLVWSCDFDLGFHGQWVREVIERLGSDAVVLVDPSAGLVDPKLIDDVISHASAHPNVEICFTQAAPGLAGVLLRPALVDRLAGAQTHPGRLLHYLPDQPMRDPIGGDGCAAVPVPVARTTRSFRLDSERQIQRLTAASVHLNGELVQTDAEDLVHRLNWTAEIDALPREVVLELNTDRVTSPIFWPGRFQKFQRSAMSTSLATQIIEQLAEAEDVRLTLAGVGDPILHPELCRVVELAKEMGICAIHVETDLLADGDVIHRLAECPIDVVSIHLPALTQSTYGAVMNVDQFVQAIQNIQRFVIRRQRAGRSTPLVVPVFTKCSANLAEMETWYDQWLKAVNAAVIRGPADFAGLIPDCSIADMSPIKRQACGRLWSRMTILSDGRVVSCEQDVLGRQVVGDAASHALRDIWRSGFAALRDAHKGGIWSAGPACAACREWHRH